MTERNGESTSIDNYQKSKQKVCKFCGATLTGREIKCPKCGALLVKKESIPNEKTYNKTPDENNFSNRKNINDVEKDNKQSPLSNNEKIKKFSIKSKNIVLGAIIFCVALLVIIFIAFVINNYTNTELKDNSKTITSNLSTNKNNNNYSLTISDFTDCGIIPDLAISEIYAYYYNLAEMSLGRINLLDESEYDSIDRIAKKYVESYLLKLNPLENETYILKLDGSSVQGDRTWTFVSRYMNRIDGFEHICVRVFVVKE